MGTDQDRIDGGTDWRAWQLVDSAFPTGAFAHSLGLEAAWQHGEIVGSDHLFRFARSVVVQTAHGVVPLVNAAYRAPARLADLSALNDAFLTNGIANRASRIQGRTLVATASRVWPGPGLQALRDQLPSMAAHIAPLTGVVFRQLGVSLATTQRVVMFAAARTVLSAAVRLGIAGGYETQSMQSGLEASAMSALEGVADATEEALAQTAPLIDILQGTHDRLYSRLFQS